MIMKLQSPAAVGAGRARMHVDTLGQEYDCNLSMTFTTESPAVKHILRRYPISRQRARIVAELSGLGGRN